MISNEVTQNGEAVAMDAQETITTSEEKDNEDDRKIFVGGLSWETTSKDMKDYFSEFGEVVTCTLKTDIDTRRSRGFGFVVFTTIDAVDKALEKTEHKLHGRTIDPKRANPRVKEEMKKIFVGKLDPTVSESTVKEHFSKFGTVEKVELPMDRTTEQRKSFCFVEFNTEESALKCLKDKHEINGVELDVKKAAPPNQGSRGRGRGFGGRGGRGRGGGWGGSWGGGYGDYYGYGGGYGGYGGYGYGGYPDYYGYGQGYGSWPGYDQGYGYGGYGYDYGWYGPEQGQQQSTYGKTPKRGGGGGGGNYHPYSR